MDEITDAIKTLKEAMIFLVEQEKIRGDEVKALNSKIEAVNSTLMDNVINPMNQVYKDDRFEDFHSKYGDRLDKHDDVIRSSMGDPDYSTSREAFEEYDNAPNKDEIDVDKYVDSVESGIDDYVASIKKSLGIPEDEAVEIKDDGEGSVEVKADEDGDGKPETVVSEEMETEEDEIDPELQKELDEWASK